MWRIVISMSNQPMYLHHKCELVWSSTCRIGTTTHRKRELPSKYGDGHYKRTNRGKRRNLVALEIACKKERIGDYPKIPLRAREERQALSKHQPHSWSLRNAITKIGIHRSEKDKIEQSVVRSRKRSSQDKPWQSQRPRVSQSLGMRSKIKVPVIVKSKGSSTIQLLLIR